MAKETRIQAGSIGDSKYYYGSDGTIVDEAGKPVPDKFVNMFPPMPKIQPAPKQRRSLKELAGKIGNSKYFFQPDGTVVDEAGEPATEKLQQIFSKRDQLQKNLPKFNKLSDTPEEKANVDQLETAFTDTIQTASKIVKINELAFRKMPIALDGMRGVVRTLAEQNYLIIRKMMQQNDEFRDKIVEQITGVKGPSKSGGAVTRPTRGPMPVSGSRAAKATAVKSKIRRSTETKSTRFRETRRTEVEARASRIAAVRAKRNIAIGTAAAAVGAAAGAGIVLGTNYLGGAAPAGAPGGAPGGTSTIGSSSVSGMVTIKTASGKSFVVAEQYAQNFKGFVDELEATGYKINSIGGYANRNIAGSNQKSFHSLGVAIDINPSSNPHLFDGRLVTDMPSNISGMARKYGLGWGGDWRSSKDAMHFSIASAEGGSLAIDRSGVSPLPGAPQIAGAAPGGVPRLPVGAGGPAPAGAPTIAAAPSAIPGSRMGAPSGRMAGGGSFDAQAPALMSRLQSDFGLTREQAAGIIGNLGHESAGLQAGIQERGVTSGRGGLGWAQWTGPRRRSFEAYLERTGQSATDPEANYGFLKEELNTSHKRALTELKKTNDVQSAMMVFEKHYEAAGVKHYEGRMNYAQRAMDLTGGATTAAATPALPVGGGGPAASTVGPQAAPQRVQTGTGGVGALAGAGGQNPVSGSAPPPNVTLGNNVDVSQVDPDLLQRFYQAAQEYGKPVTINSGYRGDDYQAELWVRANVFREPGIYSPAKPRNTTTITYQGKQYTVEGGGRGSAHGRGQALDVSPGPDLDPFLRRQGLHRPHAAFDPPHVQKIGGEEYAAASQSPSGAGAPTALPTGAGGPPPSTARPQAAPAPAPQQQALAALSQRNAVQESSGQAIGERVIIVNNDRTVNNTRTIYQRPSYSPSRGRDQTVNPLALAGLAAGFGLARALRIF